MAKGYIKGGTLNMLHRGTIPPSTHIGYSLVSMALTVPIKCEIDLQIFGEEPLYQTKSMFLLSDLLVSLDHTNNRALPPVTTHKLNGCYCV